jgi:hypothetical protein
MVGYPDGVGDDGEGWVDCATRREEAGVDDVEIIEVVGSAGAVLMADAFVGDTFFEVGAERYRAFGMAGLLENVDPAVLEAVEGGRERIV